MHRCLLILIALLFPLSSAVSRGDETNAPEQPRPVIPQVDKIAAQVRDSVVVISTENRDGKQHGIGTGFVVSEDGLIATNLHVIGEARPITVTGSDGKTLKVVAIEASDRFQDLAVLRVDLGGEKLPTLKIAESTKLIAGQPIVMMGNPHGLKHSVVAGVVSGTREIDGREMIQMAVPIEPGNSGGPVVNGDGQVVGIATMKSAVTTNLGFAVSSAALKPLLEKPNPIPMSRWLRIGVVDAKQWTTLFGANWRQRGGRILVDGAGSGFGGRSLCISKTEVPKIPFEVGVSVRLDDEAGAAGLIIHSDGANKHYGFYPSNGRLRFSCFKGPTVFSWQVLQETSSKYYKPGQWNHLKIRVESDKFICYVNDHPVVESDDTSFQSGAAGLAKFRQTEAEFKDFQVAKKINRVQVDEKTLAILRNAIDQLPSLASLQDKQLDPISKQSKASADLLRQRAEELRTRAKELDRLAAEVHLHSVIANLRLLVAKQPEEFDLLHAALLVAQVDNQELVIEDYIHEVDRMAKEISDLLDEKSKESDKLAAINKYLFQENGFHGSRFDYYERANSHINRVIDDREGLPITLSLLYMEIGRRIGLKIEGVGLPGHFVVRYVPAEGDTMLIDVFENGEQMTRNEAAAKVLAVTGRPLQDAHLEAATHQEIVARMLGNLLGLAEAKSDKAGMLRYVEALAAIDPESVQHRGMRAVLRFQNGRRNAAIADLDWIIEREPAGLDIDQLRRMRDDFRNAQP